MKENRVNENLPMKWMLNTTLAAFALFALLGTSAAYAQPGDGYVRCAAENGRCNFEGTKRVAYGANGKYAYKTATGGIDCNNATFGDPIYGTVKACYVPAGLTVGAVVSLQNGWNNWKGGYLDTRGYARDFNCQDNYLCVSTATSRTRDGGSGAWKIGSATGKANGDPVTFGDVIHLHNQWNGNGGYLDTRGYARDFNCQDNYLCVSTAQSPNRDGGSGSWKVVSASGKAGGEPVMPGDSIHLHNQWNGNGGYLDTRGYAKDFNCQDNYLCVSTASGKTRDGGSTTWRASE